jgi:selenocysteine lyase/cysteine desulfurase
MPSESSDGRIPSQRDLFEIPDGVSYLNCASMSPRLRSVSAAGAEALARSASPWNISAAQWFSGAEELRELAAKLISADADSIALVPAASYGIAVAAANVEVERGQSIVLLDGEFPSNYYAWKELAVRRGAGIRTVKRDADGGWTEAVLDAIDEKAAVVSVPNCHWTDGSFVDLERVGERARSSGASLVVDASQSAGAYPLDVEKVRPDFLVTVGYKWLLGPHALGYLYAAPKWQERGLPIENSWLARAGSEDFAKLVEYTDEYRAGARRFDMGEFPNFVTLPMGTAALRQVLEWGIENIRRTLSGLTALVAERGIELGLAPPAPQRVGHIVGLRLPKGIPAGLLERLAEEKVYVSIRGDSIRIAPHLYNDAGDVERLFDVLKELI